MKRNRVFYRVGAVSFGICYGGLLLSFWGIYTASLSAVILGIYISGPSMAVTLGAIALDLLSLRPDDRPRGWERIEAGFEYKGGR